MAMALHQGFDDRVVCLSLFHQFQPDNDHTPARHLARPAQRISGQWTQLRLEHDHVQQRWSRGQRFKCQRSLFPDSSEPAVSADANQSRQQHFAGAEPVHTDADFQLESGQWCQWLWSLHQGFDDRVVCLSLFHQFQPDNDHTPARHLARLAQRISGQWTQLRLEHDHVQQRWSRGQRFKCQRSLFPRIVIFRPSLTRHLSHRHHHLDRRHIPKHLMDRKRPVLANHLLSF